MIEPGSLIALDAHLGSISEYLLGDDILAAPVLKPSQRQRDIYLPAGLWLDVLNNKTVRGPVWLHQYGAELNQVPYFIRQSNPATERIGIE